MNVVRSMLGVVVFFAACPALASADAPDLELSVRPWAQRDGVERPYRYIVAWRTTSTTPVDAVVDRRLLAFEVRASEGRRVRRQRCRHPRAITHADRGNRRHLSSGDVYEEWIDLRMYCWGRALQSLEGGAEVEASYGWRRPTRAHWVARIEGAAVPAWRAAANSVVFEVPPNARHADTELLDAAESSPEGQTAPTPILVSLSPRSAVRGTGLSFRVSVAAREGHAYVYVRPDAFSFTVRGPHRSVTCRLPRGGGVPPRDFFTRVTSRRRVVETLDIDAFCPSGTFEEAGVYDVTPKLRLEHDGHQWELEGVTGRFRGPDAAVRITSGERGYVAHTLPTPEGES